MSAVDQSPSFTGFGDSILIPSVRQPLVQLPLAEDRESCRGVIRELAPATPGVYGWVDRNQRLLYVGKSKSLRHRLLSYFDKNPADPKTERMRGLSSRVVWESISHELLALIREQELIYRWRPSFNRLGQPERRKPGFVCVGGGQAPCAFVAADATTLAEVCLGPVVGLGELHAAVESVNYVFGLRDCSDRTRMSLSNQLPLFGDLELAKCIRFDLNSCLGPCTGGCSPGRYRQSVDAAIGFLTGEDLTILDRLQHDREQASARLAFERAGVLHRQLLSLTWLARRLAIRKRLRAELTGSFPIPSFDRRPCRLVLDQGFLVGLSDWGSGHKTKLQLRRRERNDEALAVEWMLIVAAWFQKNGEQKSLLERFDRRAERKRASAYRETPARNIGRTTNNVRLFNGKPTATARETNKTPAPTACR